MRNIKRITKKVLSAAIAAHFLFGPVFALAADIDFENAKAEYPTEQAPIQGDAFAQNVAKQAMGMGEQASSMNALKEKSEQELVRHFTRAKAQQENETSGSSMGTYYLMDNGYAGTAVFTNPCYPCDAPPSEACPNRMAIRSGESYVDNNGKIVHDDKLACEDAMIKAGGGALTSDEQFQVSMIDMYKNGHHEEAQLMTLARAAKNGGVMGVTTAIVNMINSKLQSEGVMTQSEYAALADEGEHTEQKASITQEFQNKRNVLSKVAGDAPYTVKIFPEIPAIDDGTDVAITLVPRVKKTDKEKEKYSIMVKFRDLEFQGDKWVEQPVWEDVPFYVESGSIERYPGTREIIVTYTDNDTGKQSVSRFSYTVSQPVPVLTDEGKVVNNAVVTAIMNADIYASMQGRTFQLSGKVMGAEWDSMKQACMVTVADEGISMSSGDVAIVETGNIKQEDCTSSVGTYFNMSSVGAFKDDVTGQIRFVDMGSTSNQSVFKQSLDEYMNNRSMNDEAVRSQGSALNQTVVQTYRSQGGSPGNVNGYLYGAIGTPGEGVTILPNRKTIGIGKREDADGNLFWDFVKPNGGKYEEWELRAIGEEAGVNLLQTGFDQDNMDECVIRMGESRINRNYFVESDIDQGISEIYNANRERMSRPGSGNGLMGAVQNTIKAMGQTSRGILSTATDSSPI